MTDTDPSRPVRAPARGTRRVSEASEPAAGADRRSDDHVGIRAQPRLPREARPPERWARLELQCEVNSVGPSESHEGLAQVVLSVPPTEGHDSLDETHTRTMDAFIDCLPIQRLRSEAVGSGNEDLAMVMRWFLRALADGQVKVLTTGCAAAPRTEANSLADKDRARIKPSSAKHSEHLALVTEQFDRTAHHPKPSGTPPESVTTLTEQLAQLRRLHAEALAISDALADSLAHAAAAGTETACS